ncbi:DUF1205 domain-containing protein [Thermobifida alba]|uniref:DUF1205 domain-containing protein n=1 Tax=Thermobifida alba TaxID=53522 RepID=A0ABY4KZF5_THEAE|nr:glycosyltransferase [Thermobifida alba]UPT20812.1 DUF1205 domain-containing protein [Thermobifida alba]
MKVLFTPSPGLGHLFPTVPLAQALRAAGHEVRYATGGLSLAAAEAGFNTVDATPGLDYAEVFMPEGIDGDRPVFSHDPAGAELARLFGRVSDFMVDGIVRAAREWRPDLVVSPVLQGGGPCAAETLGVPWIELPLGPEDSAPGMATDVRAAMSRAEGAPPAPAARVSTLPPSLAEALDTDKRPRGAWPMRFLPHNGTMALPEWLSRPSDSPRIVVTLGSIEAMFDGIAVLAPLLSEAGRTDAEFVVTLGGGDPELLGELPGNVRLVEWIPLDALLATASAIIHHGGTGTMLTALACGVPQCVIPQGSYQRIAADAVEKAGVGVSAAPDSVGEVQFARLLEEDLRRRVREVRAEMLAMPTPSDVAARVTALIEDGR